MNANRSKKPATRVLARAKARIRAIGNSKGLILNKDLMDKAGISANAELIIEASEGVITITQYVDHSVNTNLASWDRAFSSARKKGFKPETDLFDNLGNDFDNREW